MGILWWILHHLILFAVIGGAVLLAVYFPAVARAQRVAIVETILVVCIGQWLYDSGVNSCAKQSDRQVVAANARVVAKNTADTHTSEAITDTTRAATTTAREAAATTTAAAVTRIRTITRTIRVPAHCDAPTPADVLNEAAIDMEGQAAVERARKGGQ